MFTIIWYVFSTLLCINHTRTHVLFTVKNTPSALLVGYFLHSLFRSYSRLRRFYWCRNRLRFNLHLSRSSEYGFCSSLCQEFIELCSQTRYSFLSCGLCYLLVWLCFSSKYCLRLCLILMICLLNCDPNSS